MLIVQQPVAQPNLALTLVPLRVDRLKLAKRVWRAAAEDGKEFGFELQAALQPGVTVFQTDAARYAIVQEPEPVLEISLAMPASAAAGIGWAIGNLHLELMSEPTRLLTPDDRTVRRLLDRIGITYRETTAVFRPGRFARGDETTPSATPAHEFGPSHKH
ncbi:MAG: urease accessory protein UreE [Nibricoccus sp.]